MLEGAGRDLDVLSGLRLCGRNAVNMPVKPRVSQVGLMLMSVAVAAVVIIIMCFGTVLHV